MKVVVDLETCQNHGQCVYSAPTIFALDESGELAFRSEAATTYVSTELDESLRDDVEGAADVCPVQAIDIRG